MILASSYVDGIHINIVPFIRSLMYATFQENTNSTSKNLVLLRFFDKNIFYDFVDKINITLNWDYIVSLRKINEFN